MMTVFKDRTDAGQQLAKALDEFAGNDNVVVLALPRGGVPVAYEVARALQAPLDVMVVRKLGVPGQRELAMGAIASRNIRVMNEGIVNQLAIPQKAIDEVVEEERIELERRERLYRGSEGRCDIKGKVIILVDDGIATGATMRAAIAAIKQQQPKQLVVAVPTAALDTCQLISDEVDRMVCLSTPEPYIAVGCWYRRFSQTRDDEVTQLLEKAANYVKRSD
ncbi:MAG: phosphoribosyltransferase [Pseudomonadales bacterium]